MAPAAGGGGGGGKVAEAVTPLPMRQLMVVMFVLVSESLCGTMLIPYVGLLVAFLRNRRKEESGYLSGIMIGMFMLGQVVSSRKWGRLSDLYGRRFPLVSGLLASGIMMLLFGLSTNVWQCAVYRFLHGLLNGNVVVVKTMMADITDHTNQAKGFAFINLCSAVGTLVGPAAGGLLYDPASTPLFQALGMREDGFFARFPASLPSLVVFAYTMVGVVLCTLYLKESNPKTKPLPRWLMWICPCVLHDAGFIHASERRPAATDVAILHSGHDADDSASDAVVVLAMATSASAMEKEDKRCCEGDGDSDQCLREAQGVVEAEASTVTTSSSSSNAQMGLKASDTPHKELSSAPREMADDLCKWKKGVDDGTKADSPSKEGVAVRVAEHSATRDAAVEEEKEEERIGYAWAFSNPIMRCLLTLQMMLSSSDMTMAEVFPLWAIIPVELGGLNMGSKGIGVILVINSLPCFVSNIVFHKACSFYENKMGLFRVTVLALGAGVAFLPLSSRVPWHWLVLTLVVLFTCVRFFFLSWGYNIITMLTARAVPPSQIGAIMGINQSCVALMKATVPCLVAPVFAWTTTNNNPFPFNDVFVFFLAGISFVVCWAFSFQIFTKADGTVHRTRGEEDSSS